MRDVRAQLFDAAERILREAGPSALTSRAVTTEARCAKGVLHRHFTDFDDFLAELVLDRAAKIEQLAAGLQVSAGSGAVVENLSDALRSVFESVAVAIVALVAFRDELRARLRQRWPIGLPLMAEATAMIGGYLTAERAHGRIAAAADIDALAPALIGTGHLLFADRTGPPPDDAAVTRAVTTVVGGALAAE